MSREEELEDQLRKVNLEAQKYFEDIIDKDRMIKLMAEEIKSRKNDYSKKRKKEIEQIFYRKAREELDG